MTSPDGIEVRQLDTEELGQVLQLRWLVLDKTVGREKQTKLSEKDTNTNSIHVAAFDGQKIVATVRLNLRSGFKGTTYEVWRMATRPNYRRRGIGRETLEYAEQIAAKRGAKDFILHARESAVPFYESVGYKLNKQVEVHGGDENPVMEKSI